MNNLIRKFILFLVGYALYIAIEVTFRGYSYVLMGICGGILFILIDCINEILPWDTDLIIQCSIGSFLITLCELIVGKTLIAFNIPPMWDYSNMTFNYQGVICLEFSLIWVLISFVAILLADCLNYYVFNLTPTPYYKVLGKTVIRFKSR